LQLPKKTFPAPRVPESAGSSPKGEAARQLALQAVVAAVEGADRAALQKALQSLDAAAEFAGRKQREV
jgi:hypothetical protein